MSQQPKTVVSCLAQRHPLVARVARRYRALLAIASLAWTGCGSSGHATPHAIADIARDDGAASAPDGGSSDSGPRADSAPTPVSVLAGDAASESDAGACLQLIYLLGQDTGAAPDSSQPVVLYSFDPAGPTLRRVGPIPCISAAEELVGTAATCAPSTGGECTTAMAVDDRGIAWIFSPFIEGAAAPQKLFAVHTADASCAGAPVTVDGQGSGVVAASFIAAASASQMGTVYVSLQDVTAPSGVLTVGSIDTQSGLVHGAQAVSSPLGPLVDTAWYVTGGMATMPEGWLMFQGWTMQGPLYNGAPAVIGVDPSCEAGGCANGAPMNDAGDPESAAPGTPVWATGYTSFPSSLTSASAPWTAIWAPYFVAAAGNSMFFYDLYFFTPGWWSGGHREVTQVNLESDLSVAEAMPDLGANAFAAASGPPCPALATAPPPLPVQ